MNPFLCSWERAHNLFPTFRFHTRDVRASNENALRVLHCSYDS